MPWWFLAASGIPPPAPLDPVEDGGEQRMGLRLWELCWQRVSTLHTRGGGQEPETGTGGPKHHLQQELGASLPTSSHPPTASQHPPWHLDSQQGWPLGFGCREIAAYLGEELDKYVPKGYRITSLKHHVLQKVHQGDVRVINDNFISSRLYFFFLLTQDFDPSHIAGYCVCCQGQISSCSDSS